MREKVWIAIIVLFALTLPALHAVPAFCYLWWFLLLVCIAIRITLICTGPINDPAQMYLLSNPDPKLYEWRHYRCHHCKCPMLVFSWRGHELYTSTAPPEPKPESIQYRYSKIVDRRYWVNTCLTCGSIQGDHFVFSKPKSPQWRFSPKTREKQKSKM